MESVFRQIGVAAAQVQKEPSEESLIKIELLFGERVKVFRVEGEYVEVRTDDMDQYVGFAKNIHLIDTFEPTHRICVRFAPIYAEPNFKKPLSSGPLYFNSRVSVEDTQQTPEGLMCRIKGAGWVFETHLSDIAYRAPDFVEECLKFLGASYGYEKRSSLIDCSTLVQAGCMAAGIPCPYDVKSGEMEKLGEPVEIITDFSNLQRGDLVFWTKDKGSHVVIMVDATNCLHATIADPYRRALIQPLTEVAIDQARDNNGPITSVRRFPNYTSK
ncbi:MAG: NlpC/P60 family protein [Candidatus Paceibacterota bacterium]